MIDCYIGMIKRIALQLNLVELMRYYLKPESVNMKTLKNIYFAIFDSRPSYSCNVWSQNINTVGRSIIFLEDSTSSNEFQRPITQLVD